MLKKLTDIYPGVTPIDRTSINAWEDANFKKAIQSTGKREVIISGLWTEACVTFPTVSMIKDGYKIFVVEDACGGISKAAHKTAIKRVVQAGAIPVTAMQVLLEFQRDWNNKETYNQVMDIVKNYGGAYGMGVEYSETMLPK
jgi:nicotinamidase-related amidase